ncbi:cyclic peptide export ABC transporter [Pedobacter sp. PF22-3]|uniref:cyclic peptide export ABC transporter n=1 Tax=Pedobacter sp. PF22-3 TaxID=2994467 RepID=UPI002245824B|nr:cyclic peptide export ABC transporter [Pedobacter sp. PF22-3]MCX2492866.1 cyclic peptide export ABC transporter [Pedobacter sp. PF22-3]
MKKMMLFLIALFLMHPSLMAQKKKPPVFNFSQVDQKVLKLMKQGSIPGLSIVIIRGDKQYIKSYGYANLEKKLPVNSNTLFELGSCSKAFTALAAARLIEEGKLHPDSNVQYYLPWWNVNYKNKKANVTISELLHHTSGLPWNTISKIPQTNKPDALELTVQQLQGQELSHSPGKEYEYATINYDVTALIIQVITKQPFENYLQQQIINPLGLNHTTIGLQPEKVITATGYKNGFFKPRPYPSPLFRGNNAAGYVVSNAIDVAKWLQFQMGLVSSPLLNRALAITHRRDENVPLHSMSAYAMGWHVSLNGNREIFHDGLNPNFTSYTTFRQDNKTAVAVLANSNSNLTAVIGDRVMRIVNGEEMPKEYDTGDGLDKGFSLFAIVIGVYLLAVLAFLAIIIAAVLKGTRTYTGLSVKKLQQLLSMLLVFCPFLAGIYLLPKAITGFSWHALLVWSPVSLPVALYMIIVAMAFSYLVYGVSLLFPEKNNLKRIAPMLLLLSILSGLANMAIIIIITSSLDSKVELKYLIFYYVLTIGLYLFGRRFVQTNLIRFSRDLTNELRIKLIEKMFSTSYQKFEKIDRGRVYTALNDDLNTIGESTNVFMTLVSSVITAVGAFIYLATIAFWSAVLTIALLSIIMLLYYSVSRKVNSYFEDARDARNVFIRLTNGMIDGFKEISLHRDKKRQYKNDVADCATEYKDKVALAGIRFVDVNLVGESVLFISLGVVVFAFPKLFPGIPSYTIMNFVIILLYLIAPVNGILNSVPAVMQLRIAWNRIKQFSKEIPANLNLLEVPELESAVSSIEADGLKFKYKSEAGTFTVGPINLKAGAGEILFIIGGNGSGKTTLAKMLTGLYEPDEGSLKINDKPVSSAVIGEYFSAVFSPVHLFEKLYNIDTIAKSEEISRYLKLLDLHDKVTIRDSMYSTIALSGGQRKRLALLQCYLEDSPVYLFDEWAADQDPDYRYFFYRTLLPEMRKKGKIVIAITHDDHYFDVADKVLKMNQGQLESYVQSP